MTGKCFPYRIATLRKFRSTTRRAVIVTEREFIPRDLDRFGVTALLERGFAVTLLDCADLIFPEIAHPRNCYADFHHVDCRVVADWTAWRDQRRVLDDADLVICRVGSGYVEPRNIMVLRAIARSGAAVLMLNVNAMPNRHSVGVGQRRSLFQRLRSVSLGRSACARLPLRMLGVRSLDYLVCGGTASLAPMQLRGPKTQVIWAHASDYDTYLAERDQTVPRPIAVYLDIYMGFHDDFFAITGRQSPVSPDVFYGQLRRFFDQVERDLGLEVVIAAHPRSNYSDKPDLYGGRRILYGQTAPLVRDCALTLGFHSTSTNLAVLYRKPLIIMGQAEFQADPAFLGVLEALAAGLEKTLVPIDGPEADLSAALEVEDEAYDRYIERFIKLPDSPKMPLWPLILDTAFAPSPDTRSQ